MDYKPGNIVHIELPAPDLQAMKEFYGKVFAWSFTPLHDGYEFFDAGNIAGALVANLEPAQKGTTITVLVENVDAKLAVIEEAGGKIVQQPQNVPAGGRGRFAYFTDPCGNKLGIWME